MLPLDAKGTKEWAVVCGKEIFKGYFRSFWEKIGNIDRD